MSSIHSVFFFFLTSVAELNTVKQGSRHMLRIPHKATPYRYKWIECVQLCHCCMCHSCVLPVYKDDMLP